MQGQSRAFIFPSFWHVLLSLGMRIYCLFSILTGILESKKSFKALCPKSAELLRPYSYDFESLARCVCLTWHLNLLLAFFLLDSKVPLAVYRKGCMEVPGWVTELNEYYLPFNIMTPYNKGIAASKKSALKVVPQQSWQFHKFFFTHRISTLEWFAVGLLCVIFCCHTQLQHTTPLVNWLSSILKIHFPPSCSKQNWKNTSSFQKQSVSESWPGEITTFFMTFKILTFSEITSVDASDSGEICDLALFPQAVYILCKALSRH